MAADTQKEIFVFTDGHEQEESLLMGILKASEVRGKEVFSFEYDMEFLTSEWAFDIDPNLQLYQGPQYLPENQNNFGIFLDSSPDKWGRVLMERREAARARSEERSRKRLMESDYLLGVFDKPRMGALRFKVDLEGPFLDNDQRHVTPPMTSIRELEHASRELEEDEQFENANYLQNLALLVAPGSSLGGARPKASVKDTEGALWIAKFPSKKDDVDQGAWEYLVYQLAQICGIQISESDASTYYSDHHTFLTKRFDRNRDGDRIHFFSAMTLLGYQDGVDANAGVSYLELAELLMKRGASVSVDLEQLWRRIVFYILVSNTDDHLRNHGFLLTKKGLRLSPAFDINPNPKGYGLNLNIDEQSNDLDLDLAINVAKYFRLDEGYAGEIIASMKSAISQWSSLAESMDISRKEIDQMSSAFKM